MQNFVTVIHICTSLLLILVVLVQSGKGAEISASFGGSSQTVFGSSGGANFFTRLTTALAGIFMATSLILTILGAQSTNKSLFDQKGITLPTPTQTQANPAASVVPNASNTAPNTAPAAPTAPTTNPVQK